MSKLVEVNEHLTMEVGRDYCQLFSDHQADLIQITFDDVAAYSRALAIVKESSRYASWLKREGKV